MHGVGHLLPTPFGVARSAQSDVDFAVAGLPPEQYFRAFSEAQRLIDRPLDLIDLDYPTLFTEYLKKKGKLLRVG